MSSGISTSGAPPSSGADHSLQPWQFFVLAALGCATAVTFLTRGQGIPAIVLGTVLMAGAGLVGLAALRALRPLVSPEEDRTAMVGERTRAALEREKLLTLRTIKELEFDRAMGKLSDADWQEMSTRLRARAARLMRQLDASAGYRDQIERDLAKRLGQDPARLKPRAPADQATSSELAASDQMGRESLADQMEREAPADHMEREALAGQMEREALAEREPPASEEESALVCASCSTANDADARFCKGCGAKL